MAFRKTVKTKGINFILLDLELSIWGENLEKAEEILEKINKYIRTSMKGNKNHLIEDEKLKKLFCKYWADCTDELLAGTVANRPSRLLNYIRSSETPTREEVPGGKPLDGLADFIKWGSRHYGKEVESLTGQMIFRMKHPCWRYKIGSLVNIDKSWDDISAKRTRASLTALGDEYKPKLRSDVPAMYLGIKTLFVCTKTFAEATIAKKDYVDNFPVKRNRLLTPEHTHFTRAYNDMLLQRLGKNETFAKENKIETFIQAVEPILRSEDEVLRIIAKDCDDLKKGLREKQAWEKDEEGGSTSLLILNFDKDLHRAMSHLRSGASKKRKAALLRDMFRRANINSKECATDIKNLESVVGLLATSQDSSDRNSSSGFLYHKSYASDNTSTTLGKLYKSSKTLDKILGGIWATTLCPAVLYTKYATKKKHIGVWEDKEKWAKKNFCKEHAGEMEHIVTMLEYSKTKDDDEALPRTHYSMGRLTHEVGVANLADSNPGFDETYTGPLKMIEEEKYREKTKIRGDMFRMHTMESIKNYDGMVAFFQVWLQDGKVIYDNVPSCFVQVVEEEEGNDTGQISSIAMTAEERVEAGYPEKLWFEEIFSEY